jgi:hypothetical protein
VYGDGAYLSKTKGTAEYFAGLNSNPDGKLRVLHVQPDFSRATAMKFVDTGDGFRIKNPFYSKNQPGGTRFLNPDVKYKSREAASVSAGMTASYFSANPYMAKTNLRYLLVHQENAKTGFLPVNGINLELITPELTDAL